jgi:hypothetical protein
MRRQAHELCLWLSAVDREALARCPQETPRFLGAGGAVLTTTVMALLAGSFAAHGLLHVPIIPAVIFGLLWALAIMNLERYLQASIRRQATPLATIASALPRLALAVLLGLVITPFLLLVVFHGEDKVQVTVDRNEKLAHAREALEHQYAAVPVLAGRVAKLEGQLSTTPPVGQILQSSPEYHALAKRYGRFRSEAASAADPALARADARAANDTLAELDPLRSRLLSEEEEASKLAHSQRQNQLSEAKARLGPLQAKLTAKRGELEARYEHPPGLADQLEALNVLTSRQATVRWERDILLLFMIAIDTIPALLKTLSLLGQPTPYEQTVHEVEQSDAAEVHLTEHLRAQEVQLETEQTLEIQQAVGQARVAAQIEAQKEWDKTTLEILSETLKPHLAEWARASAESYARQLREDAGAERAPRPRSTRPPIRERPPSFPGGRGRTPRSERRY